jgi:hypothetical protein
MYRLQDTQDTQAAVGVNHEERPVKPAQTKAGKMPLNCSVRLLRAFVLCSYKSGTRFSR